VSTSARAPSTGSVGAAAEADEGPADDDDGGPADDDDGPELVSGWIPELFSGWIPPELLPHLTGGSSPRLKLTCRRRVPSGLATARTVCLLPVTGLWRTTASPAARLSNVVRAMGAS
jgi:hypothetical protein